MTDSFPCFFDCLFLKDAKAIEVKLGEHSDGFVIRVPKIEELVTVSGKWTYSDGKPVAGEWIKYEIDEKNEKIDGKQHAKTDQDGNFSLKILKGFKGRLYGEMYVYESKFADCPDLYKTISGFFKNNRSSGDITTEPIAIGATKDLSSLELKTFFPSCQKEK